MLLLKNLWESKIAFLSKTLRTVDENELSLEACENWSNSSCFPRFFLFSKAEDKIVKVKT